MRQVRSFFQPLEESTGFLVGALVFGQRRYSLGETLKESGDVGGAYMLETPQPDVAGNYWSEAPIIWAPEGADPRYVQLVRVYLWLCSGRHLVVEIGPIKNATAAPQRSRNYSSAMKGYL
jgi:hypothetical protein